jgi:CMP/dCMP kinase
LAIYVTASLQARTCRRFPEVKEADMAEMKLQKLMAALLTRDEQDMSRTASPLRCAPDALILDNTDLDIPSGYAVVRTWVLHRYPGLEPGTV